MASATAIAIRGLGKSYTIEHGRARIVTFRDVLMERMRHPFRKSNRQTFWALRDINLDISQGDVVGIVGRNGAGKSTLLKLLSRITEPTEGSIDLYGRVGSLLEVGTGFHPELTGRENIFLNGAILGMRRSEIRRQFDAIVAFAEIHEFLDTPVKRYSSGMYVRLAFAVAAHLDPEILIVDEVLAVGDVEFQKKCLGKMGQVAKSGRTVLLVTHNMAILPKLCTVGVVLGAGRIEFVGDAVAAARAYLGQRQSNTLTWTREPGTCKSGLHIQSVTVLGGSESIATDFNADQPIEIEIKYVVERAAVFSRIVIELLNERLETVFASTDCDRQYGGKDQLRKPGSHVARCLIPGGLLAPGSYQVTAAASWTRHVEYDRVEACVTFGVSKIGSLSLIDDRPGVIAPVLQWAPDEVTDVSVDDPRSFQLRSH